MLICEGQLKQELILRLKSPKRDNERPRLTCTDPLDEAAARLLDRLAHVASRGASRVEARASCSFETFMKQNPPSFDGKPNPTEAENWFLQMEKLLESLDYIDF